MHLKHVVQAEYFALLVPVARYSLEQTLLGLTLYTHTHTHTHIIYSKDIV